MMNVGIEGPDPCGFGAPATNAAAPAPLRTVPDGRRVPKEKSFDEHLDDSLSAPDKDDEPVACGPSPVPAAAPLELREAVVVADDGAARPVPASTGDTADDSLDSIAEDAVKGEIGRQADPAVEALPQGDLAADALAPDLAERQVDQQAPALPSDSKVPEDASVTGREPAQKTSDPDVEVKPDRTTNRPMKVEARTTLAHVDAPRSEPQSLKEQIVGSTSGEPVGPTSGEPVGPTFRSGEPVDPVFRSGAGDNAKPAMPELNTPPEPSASMPDVAVRAVVTAPAQFHAVVSSHVEFSAPAAAPRGPLPQETADSIIQSLRMQYQRGGGDAVVHIKPEHLGPVSVSLRVENGVVSAVVKADNPAVAEWLRTHEHVLREGLASSGLHLERFAIRRDGDPTDDARRGWREPEQRGRRRRSLQPESTFEVTV